jgi:hypothetical protein
MESHLAWFASFVKAEANQKVFKIIQGGEVFDVLLTNIGNNSPTETSDGTKPSSAEPTGFTISVAYKASPGSILFQQTYPSKEQAGQVMSDLSLACAEVESLIRQEKTEEAEKATEGLMTKFKSNSGQLPSEEKP